MARTRISVSLDLIMTPPFTEFSLKVTSCAPLDIKDITFVPSLRPPARIIPHSGCSDKHVVPCFLCNHVRNKSKIPCLKRQRNFFHGGRGRPPITLYSLPVPAYLPRTLRVLSPTFTELATSYLSKTSTTVVALSNSSTRF